MSDHILIHGDKASFDPSFGAATVVVQPGTLTGSGPATLNHKKLCIAGDQSSVSVPGCTYTTQAFPIAGTGTLQIAALAGDQTAQKTQSGNTPVLLVGSSFTAKFQVETPAQLATPKGPQTDPTPQYVGTGKFLTTNTKFTGV
ncbi:MAG TPA: hypothetical protein VF469_36355 [Kofleriaceae bacterium]